MGKTIKHKSVLQMQISQETEGGSGWDCGQRCITHQSDSESHLPYSSLQPRKMIHSLKNVTKLGRGPGTIGGEDTEDC